jgi:hypothetical protein
MKKEGNRLGGFRSAPTAGEHAIVLGAVKDAAAPRRCAVAFGHP